MIRPFFSTPTQAQNYLKPEANPVHGLLTPEMPPQQLDYQTGMPVPDYDFIQSNYGRQPGSPQYMNPGQTNLDTGIMHGTANDPSPTSADPMYTPDEWAGAPPTFQNQSDQLPMDMWGTPEEIRYQASVNQVPIGPSGMQSFDHMEPIGPVGTGDEYEQFRRKQMNMDVSPGQNRMTMTTSPRTKFDKDGFNSGLQLMNMGIGLLD